MMAFMTFPVQDVRRYKPGTRHRRGEKIHTHTLWLRLDGLYGYEINGRIDLALLVAEICADTRAVASRGLKITDGHDETLQDILGS